MDVLFIFISSLFFLWVIRELFYWLTIWQENEYRTDRFFAALKKKPRRHSYFSTLFQIGKWLVFFSFGFIVFNDDLLPPYQYAIIVLYLLQAFFLLKEIYFNHLKKPEITLRAVLIITLTLITVLLVFAIPLVDRFFWLLFVDLITPLIVAFYVLLFAFPIEIYNDWQIEKAVIKMRNHPNLLVIAVTGSVGKSMTKEYLFRLLKKKYKVIKTDGKNNTAIGIARTVLQKLDQDTQIFVAEISAYQPGEIKMLCQLIRPKIGVLTAINSYYLPLFKNLENIKNTNYELVTSLPSNGFCLYNGDNKNTFELYKNSLK
jgi:UDP-N-acetylmuramoyl-tripeptide--D-alanyl-D-alanine ligase